MSYTERKIIEYNEKLFGLFIRFDNKENWPILYCSKSVERVTGFTHKELISKTFRWWDAIHEDDKKLVDDNLKSAAEENKSVEFSFRFNSANGDLVWLRFSGGCSFFRTDVIDGIFTDITKEKKNQISVKEELNSLKISLREMGAHYWVQNIETRELKFESEQFFQRLGYAENEYPTNQDEYLSLVEPADIEKTMDTYEKHIQGLLPVHTAEYRIKTKEGKWIWTLNIARVTQRGKSGSIKEVSGITIDNTENKVAEERLNAERERLQQIMDTSPIAVALTTDSIIQYSNKRFEHIFGVRKGESIVPTYIRKQDRDTVMEQLKHQQYVFNYELNKLDKNGKVIDCIVNYSVTQIDGRESILSWILEVTPLKEAEKKADLARRTSERIFETVPVPIFVVDFNKNRILKCNKALLDFHQIERIDKYDPENIWVSFEDRMKIMNRLSVVGFVYNQEIQIRRLGTAEKVWGMYSIYPINYLGKECHIISFVDLTKIKETELQLSFAKEEAVLATKAKSEFLARMSHEIRTPMNAIIGLTHLTLQTKLAKKQREHLSKVHSSGVTLLGIVNDVLDFSKIEAGKMELDLHEFDLEKLFIDFTNVVTFKAHEKNLEVIMDLDRRIPKLLIGDSLKIKQVLVNLSNNAIKFTEEGEIVIKAEITEIKEKQLKILFSVSDTGIGLTKNEIGRLFHSFSQADGTTTRRYGGTGLGLSISKRLVELMGGEIWVESEKNTGSTFGFSLWLNTAKADSRRNDLSELKESRILICDDNKTSCTILAGLLSEIKSEITIVNNGRDAIAALEKDRGENFDLLLIDWKMAGLNGIETIKQIKKSGKIKSVPSIIMVTAYNREDVISEAIKVGVNSTLIKPVSYSTLYDTLLDVFGKNEDVREEKYSVPFLSEIKSRVQGANVLLVEDNAVNQDVAIGMLQEVGVSVEIANNGLEAVSKVRGSGNPSKYELVIMDLQMPVMDGYDATIEIRKMDEYKKLPIVALTADAVEEIKENCLRIGMNDFISKPINPDTFYLSVDKWIQVVENRTEVQVPIAENEVQEITAIEGVNLKNGLNRINNKLSLYQKLLIKFYKHYEGFVDEIRKRHRESENIDDLKKDIHTLKGVAGNIGAEKLFLYSKNFEQKLKEDGQNSIDKDLDELQNLITPILDSIKAQLITGKEDTTSDIAVVFDENKKEQLDKILEELKILLSRNSFKAVNKTNELMRLVAGTELERHATKIEEFVSDYEFEKSFAELKEFMKHITT
ncbi:response regulator [Maribellus maritimus]|uniref:response regulator n=1 Tax=Maribellus maritimus TaxID=2870838 RepID=UPI001EEA0D7D|nr:response regulator [Maribellus maritimus]MCG6189425.1 response regulator [Maribellus maritimus]